MVAVRNLFVVDRSYSFCFTIFANTTQEMDDVLLPALAVQRGYQFRKGDLVNVVEGTHAGIPGTHSEPFRARFIGVKDNDTFFVRPIIGSQRGRPPRGPKKRRYYSNKGFWFMHNEWTPGDTEE
jgi:hypothetical protein